ncbi:hypothetical protein EMIT0215P_90086 [Pseudomonas serboccidentalis]
MAILDRRLSPTGGGAAEFSLITSGNQSGGFLPIKSRQDAKVRMYRSYKLVEDQLAVQVERG